MDVEQAARREIEALHEFFVAWFSGAAAADAFGPGFEHRFAPDFVLVPPAGGAVALDGLRDAVRGGHGTNPEFKIEIRNVRVRLATDDVVIAMYEEWQRNALASKPPDNGRVATVVFQRQTGSDDLRWLLVHETWLPADVMAAGPYDF